MTHFPGADYNNVRVKDFKAARFHDACMIDKSRIPRMPWRDMHVRLEGEIAKDMGRNFIQYWSFIKNDFAQQKESRQIGVSATKQIQQRKLTRKNSEEINIGSTKRYMPKSSLVPPTNKKIFEESLDDDSTMTKHEKNLLAIPEVEEPAEFKKRDNRLFKSLDNRCRIELEDLVNQVKEQPETEEDDFSEK